MIVPQDDLIGHQLPHSFAYTGTSDPTWMERLWYSAHPVPGGDVILNVGCGYHPNRNVFDAHAGITVGKRQHNLRFSQRLGADPLSAAIGPLRFQVLEGLRRHRLVLEPNEAGLSFDIEFSSVLNPHEENRHTVRRNLRLQHDITRYQQSGRYSGWVQLHETRFDLTADAWWGQRDHSWGLRRELRTDPAHPPMSEYPPHLFTWLVAQFDDCALHLFMQESQPGRPLYLTGELVFKQDLPRDGQWAIKDVEHDLRWANDPHGQTVESGTLIVTFANGQSRKFTLRALPARYFLKGGMYGGYRGWFQGDDKGPYHFEHDVWDLSDAGTRTEARTLGDNVFEFSDGKRNGYGIFEWWVLKGYPRYEEVQKFPAP
ncbi:hypothetical protein [Bradyrhizobium sp. SHOUNA76]|uniref:hypothetical protein n=1 Tax=Bradyrhizobium sp. SHOUNA76 TaxID=2908927 RepID=UPI001FF5BE49|nr:hypothetical protein [Bradyrhizobium sp. SHOUNA76]MCJ9699613.1 hypothetical protein [Bradyrhizobium sp. SHOUNA76]